MDNLLFSGCNNHFVEYLWLLLVVPLVYDRIDILLESFFCPSWSTLFKYSLPYSIAFSGYVLTSAKTVYNIISPILFGFFMSIY